ncbi:YvcK family protein [bacterium]|nr:MAG: YvcK family protein [bacterium]
MTRPHRLRRLLAPTRGLQKAIGLQLLGLVTLVLGGALSFKNLILPFFSWLFRIFRNWAELVIPDHSAETIHWLGGLFLLLGGLCMWRGIRALMTHIIETLNPSLKGGKVDIYMRRQMLAQGPRVVALGGGTGLSTLLRGLKTHTSNITAVVTVTDDGGSSGKLVREKGMIPPGDIRNCLVALADAERAMIDLFQHRFKDDSGSLSGHSIGNLLLAALADQSKGDFEIAVQKASDVLAIRGQVVPSTFDQVALKAELEDGSVVEGETSIVAAGSRIRRLFLNPIEVKANRTALEAIREADIIVMGPGSVYTSIIPNLLVPGMAEALVASPAPKVYVCNVMTQRGESEGMTASQHVAAIQEQVGRRVFDYIIVNTAIPSESAIEKYAGAGQQPVEADIDRLRAMNQRILPGDYMSETDLVRHDPMKVASRVMALVE